jgi:hypothetical protein
LVSGLTILVNFLPVIEKIGQRGMDVGEADAGKLVNDFIGTVATLFVPSDDVGDANTVPRDTRSSIRSGSRKFSKRLRQFS